MDTREKCICLTVAAVVTALVIVTNLAPLSWAERQAAAPAIPALPPGELRIPSLDAIITASANPDPGQSIRVKLNLTSAPDHKGKSVPVTVMITSSTASPMTRRIPMPTQVAETSATLTIGQDGTASAEVHFPHLTWGPMTVPSTAPADDSNELMRERTTYQVVLISPLVAGNQRLILPPAENRQVQ